MTMKISMSEFKATCTKVVREIADAPYAVEITNRGKVVAVVTAPPAESEADPQHFWGSLQGSVMEIAADFDEPMGDQDWDAAR